MGFNVVRIGDGVSCGDRLGQGSPNVFANNIAVGRITQDNTAGHCFVPIQADRPGYTVYVNNKPIMLKTISFIFPHCCPGSGCHDGVYVQGSPNVFAEFPAGSLANEEIPDAVAEYLGIDKQSYTDACIKLTFGHLVDEWDDTDSDESNTQVPSIQTYNNVVPEKPITDPNQAPPAGLTNEQGRKYVPPVKLTNNYGQDKTISDACIRTDQTTLAGTSDEYAGGKTTTQRRTRVNETPEPAQTSTNTNVISANFSDIDSHTGPWPRDFPLSTHFVLGQFAMGYNGQPRCDKYPIKDNAGLTEKQIVKNLRALCVNVLEPLRAHFPSMLINSGFRLKTGRSQHNKGMAADVFVPEIQQDAEALYQGALWIRDNLNYDQFIFETAGRNVWYHLSYNMAGNRPKNSPDAVMTTTTGGSPYAHRLFKIPR
jgi:hypothetical protein